MRISWLLLLSTAAAVELDVDDPGMFKHGAKEKKRKKLTKQIRSNRSPGKSRRICSHTIPV